MLLLPHKEIRRRDRLYGSLTLAKSIRGGPGSTTSTDDVDTTMDRIKSFAIRASVAGSFYVQATVGGTQDYATIVEGTFPAGRGSWTVRSFEEAFNRMRMQIRLPAAGSYSVAYGGVAWRR